MRAYNYGDSTIDAQIPWWPSKMLIPFAFGLLFLRLLLNLVGYVRLFANADAAPVAVPLIANVRRLAEEEAAEAGALDTRRDSPSGRTGA